jgi:HD-GYP domain-containing protein (c-di-GMP phosphodiesterase class II)
MHPVQNIRQLHGWAVAFSRFMGKTKPLTGWVVIDSAPYRVKFYHRTDKSGSRGVVTVVSAAESLSNSAFFQTNETRTLLLMASALGLKDKYTHGHAQRVSEYARRLALRLDLPMRDVIQIAMGGMMHDVGKLALSDSIFSNQATSLTEELLWEVHHHSLIGAAMLKRTQCAKAITDAVLFHHERIDGTGYPFGLKGSTIPLSARIVSIVDCFDAITTDRPYQKRKSVHFAVDTLHECAGSYLDAELVPLFIEEIDCNGIIKGVSKDTITGAFPL